MTKRMTYTLTPAELDERHSLPPREGVAWAFWRRVAQVRGLDPRSIIGTIAIDRFTALPLDHRLAWCHPLPLKCGAPPERALPQEFIHG